MGKFDNILIFSDIDGTYLDEHRKTVERNIDAIRYFRENGGTFTFATGRMPLTFLKVVPNVCEVTDFPVILNNGTCLFDFHKNTPIYSEFMEEERVKHFIAYAAESFPNVGFRASTPEGYTYAFDHPILLRDFGLYENPGERKKPLSAWDYGRIYKIAFRERNAELLRMKDALVPVFGDEFCIIMSEEEILEVQNKGASKGAAIERVRRDLKKKGTPKRIVCIGDHENDLDMLRVADIAACPSNAIPSVKEICSVQLCSCDDGAVADLIEYLEAHPVLLA